jgi:hypothetical protein
MGTWGLGLYSSDFAVDLRPAVAAVSRLPFSADRLVEILCSLQPAAAGSPDDPDHTVFWLVLADQFTRRGLGCDRVRERALAIIDGGTDLAMMRRLRLNDVAPRRKQLAQLRSRLVAPANARHPRRVLKKPQIFRMAVGDVLVYPTSGGECINSYFPSKERIPNWHQDGWGAVVIIERGLAFDFLAWYRPLTIDSALSERPTLPALLRAPLWVLKRPGTCSAVHFKRLKLARIGLVSVADEKLRNSFPCAPSGSSDAINDISLANRLNVGPAVPRALMPAPGEQVKRTHGHPHVTISSLEQIISHHESND